MAREDWLTYLYQRLQAIGAGWLYPYMVALVQRESSWRPDAIGTIAPGEYSIGLFQINMGSGLGPSRARAYFGTDDVEAARERLKDPYTNIDIAIRHFIQPALEGGAEDVAQILRPWGAGHLAIRDVQEGLAAQGPRGGKLARPALEEGEDMPEDEEGGTSAIERWVEENLPTAGTDSDLRARLRPVLGRPGIYFDPQTGAYYVMERVSTTTRIPLTNVEVPADIEAPRRLTASELETLGLRAPGPEAAPSPGAEYNRIVQAVQDGIITPEEGAQAIRRLTLGEEAAQLGPQPNQNIENILWAAQSGILSNEEAVAAIRSELLGAQASPNLGADFNRILFAASSGLISEEEAVTAIRRLVLGEPQAPMRPAVTYSDVGGLRQYFDAEGNLVGTRELREGEIARRPPKSYVDMGGVRFFLDEAGNLVDSIQIPEGEAAAVQPWTAMFRPARSFAELLAEAPGGDVRELGGDFATRSLVGAGHSGAISGMTGGGLPRSAEELEGLARARLQAPVGTTPWQLLA
ncbi:MAG TPA: transglycosylase SLT domain-containing protein, partial [Dehalococcoidia bacterium]|nr:transglycosylase SLT domain-containing protein [Dehalococcoidia bacterium]